MRYMLELCTVGHQEEAIILHTQKESMGNGTIFQTRMLRLDLWIAWDRPILILYFIENWQKIIMNKMINNNNCIMKKLNIHYRNNNIIKAQTKQNNSNNNLYKNSNNNKTNNKNTNYNIIKLHLQPIINSKNSTDFIFIYKLISYISLILHS